VADTVQMPPVARRRQYVINHSLSRATTRTQPCTQLAAGRRYRAVSRVNVRVSLSLTSSPG